MNSPSLNSEKSNDSLLGTTSEGGENKAKPRSRYVRQLVLLRSYTD